MLRLMEFIEKKKRVPYAEAYQLIHMHFPDYRDFEGILSGLLRAGKAKVEQHGTEVMLVWIGE